MGSGLLAPGAAGMGADGMRACVILFRGCFLAIASFLLSEFINLADNSVDTSEGAIQFNLIFGAHSAAKLFVKASTLDLHIDIDVWYGIPKLAAIELKVTIDESLFSDL